MKKILLTLFVMGLLACGGQKQEPAVEESKQEEMQPADTTAVDTTAVDSMATDAGDQSQE